MVDITEPSILILRGENQSTTETNISPAYMYQSVSIHFVFGILIFRFYLIFDSSISIYAFAIF